MALPTASDNVFPKVIMAEAAAPATPSSGQVKLYAKADGLLYSKDDAGTETLVSGGSGGSSDLDAIIAASSGQDISDALAGAAAPDSGNVFATMADVGGGGGGVDLPDPDRIPASPHASDQEFNAALSGNTTNGTIDTTTVAGSLLYIKRARTGAGLDSITWAAPAGGVPFTVTLKMPDSSIPSGTNYHHAGLVLGDNAGKFCTLGLVSNAAALYAVLYRWNSTTSFASNIDVNQNLDARTDSLPAYLKLLVTSASSVTGYISQDGLYYRALSGIAAVTTGLAAVTKVGVGIGDPAGTTTVEAWFDYERFS